MVGGQRRFILVTSIQDMFRLCVLLFASVGQAMHLVAPVSNAQLSTDAKRRDHEGETGTSTYIVLQSEQTSSMLAHPAKLCDTSCMKTLRRASGPALLCLLCRACGKKTGVPIAIAFPGIT